MEGAREIRNGRLGRLLGYKRLLGREGGKEVTCAVTRSKFLSVQKQAESSNKIHLLKKGHKRKVSPTISSCEPFTYEDALKNYGGGDKEIEPQCSSMVGKCCSTTELYFLQVRIDVYTFIHQIFTATEKGLVIIQAQQS